MKGMEAEGSRPYNHYSGSISDEGQELERPGMVNLLVKAKFEETGFFRAKRRII